MKTSAIQSLLSAILLGAMLAVSAPVAADEVRDSSITSWINEALRHDPLVPASEISVRTREGIVTLSGRVDNLAVKNRVDRHATNIRGVREVLNELTVAPSPLSDADIVYAIRRRILNNATIVSQRIVVTSVDGSVTIQGEVANWSEAEEAALLASAATGVKNVKNELVTRYTATRSDQEIKMAWTRPQPSGVFSNRPHAVSESRSLSQYRLPSRNTSVSSGSSSTAC
jgi:hyperosmotically inducible protein